MVPAEIAKIALEGIEAGETEIVADDSSLKVRAGLAGGIRTLSPTWPDERPVHRAAAMDRLDTTVTVPFLGTARTASVRP